MSNKKILTLIIVLVVSIGITGASFAWFTSSDKVKNEFSTANGGDVTDPDAGIKILEEFKPEDAKDITPGKVVNKDVQVESTANYPQFIRVKFEKQFVSGAKDVNGEDIIITENFNKTLDLAMIELAFRDNLATTMSDGTWFKGSVTEDGKIQDYYYYIGKVGTGSYTNTLLDSVKLSATAGNEYKNLGFNVIVKSDAIQATSDAYKDWAPVDLHDKFAVLQNGTDTIPTDTKEADGTDVKNPLP